MTRRKTLVIDFDGVLHAYTSPWTTADEVRDGPVPGAMAFLREAVKRFDVAVVSSRSHESGGIEAMAEAIFLWCNEEFGYGQPTLHVDDDGIRTLSPSEDDEGGWITFPLHKPPAHLTIDDRAVTFKGLWPTVAEIEAFKPWKVGQDIQRPLWVACDETGELRGAGPGPVGHQGEPGVPGVQPFEEAVAQADVPEELKDRWLGTGSSHGSVVVESAVDSRGQTILLHDDGRWEVMAGTEVKPGHLPATEDLYALKWARIHVQKVVASTTSKEARDNARWAAEYLQRIAEPSED